VELEFLFDSDIEGTHVSEMVAELASEFDTEIKKAEILLDRDNPDTPDQEGGVALYYLYPNRPGLLEAAQARLSDFDLEVAISPTKGL